MDVMEWMKSKATKTEQEMEIDGIKYIKRSFDFIGKLPYHMMRDVSSAYFDQKVLGSVDSGDYREVCESMHRYGDKNARGVYNFTEFVQI